MQTTRFSLLEYLSTQEAWNTWLDTHWSDSENLGPARTHRADGAKFKGYACLVGASRQALLTAPGHTDGAGAFPPAPQHPSLLLAAPVRPQAYCQGSEPQPRHGTSSRSFTHSSDFYRIMFNYN